MGQDKHGEKLVTNYPPGKNRLTLGNYLIYCQSDQSGKMRNKVKSLKYLPFTPLFFLNLILLF